MGKKYLEERDSRKEGQKEKEFLIKEVVTRTYRTKGANMQDARNNYKDAAYKEDVEVVMVQLYDPENDPAENAPKLPATPGPAPAPEVIPVEPGPGQNPPGGPPVKDPFIKPEKDKK